MIFKVKVRGTTYFGKAAGIGDQDHDCSELAEGDLTEEIRYWDMTKASSGLWSLFGKRSGEIKRGYISKASYSHFEDMTVVLFRPSDEGTIKTKPMATYALYRAN